jgi:hypothetical protein
MKLEFSRQISEKSTKYQNSRKSMQCEPSYSMRKEIRTDTTKQIVAFRNFVKTPKKENEKNARQGSRKYIQLPKKPDWE